MLIKKMAMTTVPYSGPIQNSAAVENRVRSEKEQTVDLRQKLTEQVAHDYPRATKEGVNGMVTKLLNQHLHDAEVPEDPELTMKPNMDKTLKPQKTKIYFHNGKYEVNKFDPKGKKAWSCCQAKDEDACGCQIKIKDAQKWCL